ncbi:hypothetical protein, partial [Sporosarcina ureae]|uniref:hypothetical protein n=1 Tax=Sporosarcina ureae TaxID=1571 RepID=UPI0026EC405E
DLSNQKILLELQEFSNELISLNKESKAYSGESLTRVLSRNLDRANYTYAMHTRSLPMRKLHISPEHKRNRYSYQKYIGAIFGPKGFPF